MSHKKQTTLANAENDVFFDSCNFFYSGLHNVSNENSVLEMCDYGIFGVAGGVGAPDGSKKATEIVMKSIRDRCSNISADNEIKVMATINEALVRAKVKIQQFARDKGLQGIGATIAILRLNPSNKSAYIVHAGDSRVYRLRNGSLVQLTRDHISDDKPDVKDKAVDSEKGITRLTRAIGLYERINLETTTIELQPNDLFLLWSSQLHKHWHKTQISQVLTTSLSKGMKYTGSTLIRKVKKWEPKDEVSLVLVKVVSDNAGEEPKNRKPIEMRLAISLASLLLVICLWILFIRNNRSEKQYDSNKKVNEIVETKDVSPKVANQEIADPIKPEKTLASQEEPMSINEKDISQTQPIEGAVTTNTTKAKTTTDKKTGESYKSEVRSSELSKPMQKTMTASNLTEKKPASNVEIMRPKSKSSPLQDIDSLHAFKTAQREQGFANALKRCAVDWAKIGTDVRRKLNVLILKEINKLCHKAKQNNYDNGDEIRTFFAQAILIDDSLLQRAIIERKKLFDVDFAIVLNDTIQKAKISCDWAKTRKFFLGNHQLSKELNDSESVIYAKAWSKFIDLSERGKPEHMEYIHELISVSKRIQPFSEINESLSSELMDFSNAEIVSSEEYCNKIKTFSSKIRNSLVNSAERLRLNLSILDLNKLDTLLQSTYSDEVTLEEKMAKLSVFQATAEQLAIVQKRLGREEEWIPPEIQLAEFNNWSLEIQKMASDVQYCLQFVWVVLRDYQQIAEDSGKKFFEDPKVVADYATELKKIESLFSSDFAKSLSKRFQIAANSN